MIVVGFGYAGYSAVKAMREEGYDGEIEVFTGSAEAPYNPMLTTYYISGKIQREEQLPFGRLAELAEKYHFMVRVEQVRHVYAKEKKVELENGKKESFDRLLISTGAHVFCPPISGVPGKNIYFMRTMEDSDLLRQRLEQKDAGFAVVVGASMVGIKIVELMTKQGVRCTLADNANHMFPLSTLPATAERIDEIVRNNGVDLLLGAAITGVEQKKEQLLTHFSNGETRKADLLVLCIGTRANTALVDPEEIEVRRGIVVDRNMRTSVSDIYAAGDCCEGRNCQSDENQIIGLWANGGKQGDCAGRIMSGQNREYEGTILQNITGVFGTYFIGLGDNRCNGVRKRFTSIDGSIWIETLKNENHLECINILNGYSVSGIIKSIFLRQLRHVETELSVIEVARLRSAGLSDELLMELGVYQSNDWSGKED